MRSPQSTGLDAGRFFPFGNATDLPPDQRAEDGRSVCFDLLVTEARPLDVLGNVVVDLAVTSDLPDGDGHRPALRRRPRRQLDARHPGRPQPERAPRA